MGGELVKVLIVILRRVLRFMEQLECAIQPEKDVAKGANKVILIKNCTFLRFEVYIGASSKYSDTFQNLEEDRLSLWIRNRGSRVKLKVPVGATKSSNNRRLSTEES